MIELALWITVSLGLSYGAYRGLSWLAATKDLVHEDGLPKKCPACHNEGAHVGGPWMHTYDKRDNLMRAQCFNCGFTCAAKVKPWLP